jgi:hypothetical protein
MDKVTDALLAALKQALAEPGEQRLFRSGKLAGLFPGRAGANGDAAARALRDGLLEVARTEQRGKTAVDWVRLTPRGVAFLHDHESPVRALQELRAAVQATQESAPAWLEEMRRSLQALDTRLTEEVRRVVHRLEALGRRAEETLRRLEASVTPTPEAVAALVPWAPDALAYLDKRRAAQAPGECPLPELFAALAEGHALTVTAFHDGLRRLQDQRVLRLLPFAAPPSELPQPEFALPDGATVLYYAGR